MPFTNPEENIAHLGLHKGAVVADLGSGTGFYTLAMAKTLKRLSVDEAGAEESEESTVTGSKVYAVDVQKELLDRLNAEATEQDLGDYVEIMWGDIDELGGTNLADRCCDAVIIANTFFQSENKAEFAREAARVLKPGGKLLLIDWTDSFGNLGPTAEMVVPAAIASPYFVDAGLTQVEEYISGEHHYGLMFSKQ